MSGGVDRAVAALLVARRRRSGGRVTLELWSDPANDGELSCCSAQAVRGARALAHGLGVPHFSIDLRAEFRAGVVDPWLTDHAAGLTPNPCVRCNGSVRLDAMLELAARLGSRHARDRPLRAHPSRRSRARTAAADGRRPGQGPELRARGLSPDSIQRLRFPLGELTKPEVRALAERAGLPVARRPDSQDLCFLAGAAPTDFLARHGGLGVHAGPIVDRDGRRLGEHSGTHTFTVGQRRHLGAGRGWTTAASRCTCSRPTPSRTPSPSALARSCSTRSVPVRDAILHRDGGVSTRSRSATQPAPALPAHRRSRGRRPRARSRSSCSIRPSAPPLARSPACTPTTNRRPRHNRSCVLASLDPRPRQPDVEPKINRR